MPDPIKQCRYCAKDMPKGSIYRHEHQMCPHRTGASAESPTPQAQVPQAETKARAAVHHARQPLKKRILTAVGKLTQAAAKELVSAGAVVGDGHHCERQQCPYRGLSSHLAKVRVQELVRAGLGLEDAARFVREHCAC